MDGGVADGAPAGGRGVIMVGHIAADYEARVVAAVPGQESVPDPPTLSVVGFAPASGLASAAAERVLVLLPVGSADVCTAAAALRGTAGVTAPRTDAEAAASLSAAAAAQRGRAGAESAGAAEASAPLFCLGQALLDHGAGALLAPAVAPALPGPALPPFATHVLLPTSASNVASVPATSAAVGAAGASAPTAPSVLTLRRLRESIAIGDERPSPSQAWAAAPVAASSGSVAGPKGAAEPHADAGDGAALAAETLQGLWGASGRRPMPRGSSSVAAAGRERLGWAHESGAGTSAWLPAGVVGTAEAVRAELASALGRWGAAEASSRLEATEGRLPDLQLAERAAQWALDAAAACGDARPCRWAADRIAVAADRLYAAKSRGREREVASLCGRLERLAARLEDAADRA